MIVAWLIVLTVAVVLIYVGIIWSFRSSIKMRKELRNGAISEIGVFHRTARTDTNELWKRLRDLENDHED